MFIGYKKKKDVFQIPTYMHRRVPLDTIMQLAIYLILALVDLNVAEQFDSGPKVSKGTSQSLDSHNSAAKIYSTKEIIVYLTPREIKNLQAAKSAENKESSVDNKKDEQQPSLQDYNNEQHQNAWSQYYKSLSENKALQAAKSAESQESSVENKKEDEKLSLQDYNDEQHQNAWSQYYKSLSENNALQAAKSAENQELSVENKKEEQELSKNQKSLQDSNVEQQQNVWSQYYKSLQAEEPKQEWQNVYYTKDKPVFENHPDSVDAYNSNYEQNTKVQLQNNKNEEERELQESEWISYNNDAAKKQEEALLQDQLQQHWNRILNHNRAQLRGLSAIGKEQLNSESSNEGEKVVPKWQPSSRNQEDIKSDIEKQIEFILKEALDFEKQSNGDKADHINQRQPIVIHKEVRVTKHYKVPVVEKVKVPVPRPVLVPIPEPYEVKVPHPYPVPVEIVKHIPVPVFRNK